MRSKIIFYRLIATIYFSLFRKLAYVILGLFFQQYVVVMMYLLRMTSIPDGETYLSTY